MRYMGEIIRMGRKPRKGTGLLRIEDAGLRHQGYDQIRFSVADTFKNNPIVRPRQRVSFEIKSDHLGLRAIDVFVIPDNAPILFDPDTLDDFEAAHEIRRNAIEPKEEESSSHGRQFSEDQFVALALLGGKLRLVSLAKDGEYKFLDDKWNLHNIFYTAISETLLLRTAIEEFESLLNSPKAGEADFQTFFERNSDFILSGEYKEAHPHLVLIKETGESLIPDFVLQPIEQSSLCDILELKLPSANIFVLKKNRARYSSAVFEAAAQLREYSRFFDEERHRDQFQLAYPGLRAFRPRMFVIIGRQEKEEPLTRREIQTDFPNLTLRTYDDVVARMKWQLKRMNTGKLRV